jgi:hypothetical protein
MHNDIIRYNIFDVIYGLTQRLTLLEGIEPSIYRLTVGRLNHWAIGAQLSPAGFEPAHPEIADLKSAALDHSAMMTMVSFTV